MFVAPRSGVFVVMSLGGMRGDVSASLIPAEREQRNAAVRHAHASREHGTRHPA